jgi:hypothetical protein
MDILPTLHTYAKLMYDQGVQEVDKHFVQDLGARSHHEANKEDYEEGVGRMIHLWIYKTLEMMEIS